MIYKESTFSSFTPDGMPLMGVIDPSSPFDPMEKTAGIHPEVLKFKQMLEPEPDKTYVHILALGAGDFYGPNLNNDHFPWAGLSHDSTTTPHPYLHGYKTFLNAHSFAHHVNKDPAKSYGDVIFSTLNHKMKRVELITAIDHARCEKNGGKDILRKIHDGQYPSTSMGCRVPYDVCSICGNKARVRNEYCDHMKMSPGKILADGRKVFVYNHYPRFFDISFVFIGADRTSFVLEKIASGSGVFMPGLGRGVEKLAMDASGYNEALAAFGKTHKAETDQLVQALQAELNAELERHGHKMAVGGPVPTDASGRLIRGDNGIKINLSANPGGSSAADQSAARKVAETFEAKLDALIAERNKVFDAFAEEQRVKFNMPKSGGAAAHGMSTLGKVGLGLGAAGLLGYGAYRMMNREKTASTRLSKSLRQGAGMKQKNTRMRIKRKVARQQKLTPKLLTFGKLQKGIAPNAYAGSMLAQKSMNPNSSVTLRGAGELAFNNDAQGGVDAFMSRTISTANLSKEAGLKLAEAAKVAEIFKRVNSLPMGRAVPMRVGREAMIPDDILDSMADRGDLPHTLGGLGAAGIMLRPREFQRVYLRSHGEHELARDLHDEGRVFSPRPGHVGMMRVSVMGRAPSSLMSLLGPILRERSSLSPVAVRRVAIISKRPLIKEGAYIEDPVLDHVAEAYDAYRTNLALMSEELMKTAMHTPEIMSMVRAERGGDYDSSHGIMEALSLLPVLYFVTAYREHVCHCGMTPMEFALKFACQNPDLAKYLARLLARCS